MQSQPKLVKLENGVLPDASRPAFLIYIYDIPKEASMTCGVMKEELWKKGVKASVQLHRNGVKPFITGVAKVNSEQAYLQALERIRYFTYKGKTLRCLPFEPNLFKNLNNNPMKNNLIKNFTQNLTNFSQLQNYYKNEMEINPSNNVAECNIFVKGLDKNLNSKDLFDIFIKYGPIKSAKVSIHPNHESKGYGFVWFSDTQTAKQVMKLSEEKVIPFQCSLYCMKKMSQIVENSRNSIKVRNISKRTTKQKLMEIFKSAGKIMNIFFVKDSDNYEYYALIEYSDEQSALKAVEIFNKTQSDKTQLDVSHSLTEKIQAYIKSKEAERGCIKRIQNTDNMVFLRGIPEKVNENELRKYIASNFGAIIRLSIRKDSQNPKSLNATLSFTKIEYAQTLLNQKKFQYEDHEIRVYPYLNKNPKKQIAQQEQEEVKTSQKDLEIKEKESKVLNCLMKSVIDLDLKKIPTTEEIEGIKVGEVLSFLEKEWVKTELDKKILFQRQTGVVIPNDLSVLFDNLKDAYFYNEKISFQTWVHHYLEYYCHSKDLFRTSPKRKDVCQDEVKRKLDKMEDFELINYLQTEEAFENYVEKVIGNVPYEDDE